MTSDNNDNHDVSASASASASAAGPDTDSSCVYGADGAPDEAGGAAGAGVGAADVEGNTAWRRAGFAPLGPGKAGTYARARADAKAGAGGAGGGTATGGAGAGTARSSHMPVLRERASNNSITQPRTSALGSAASAANAGATGASDGDASAVDVDDERGDGSRGNVSAAPLCLDRACLLMTHLYVVQ
jgi:hypothetical protein